MSSRFANALSLNHPIRVQFAPDYTTDNPYQNLLIEALKQYDVEVELISHYKRGLPLYRSVHSQALHLHWPEAYWNKNGAHGTIQKLRFLRDLKLAKRKKSLFVTAHNLYPHNQRNVLSDRNIKATYQLADAIFVHSEGCADVLKKTHGVTSEQIVQIPFGDHSAHQQHAMEINQARTKLDLPINEKICLHFGAISAYKGSLELLSSWNSDEKTPLLLVAGTIFDENLAKKLENIANQNPRILYRPGKVNDEEIPTLFGACDCAIFNYKQIFSSGAACHARSFGLPIIVPKRCDTLELGEPNPTVFRFNKVGKDDFWQSVSQASNLGRNNREGQNWKQETSWDKVAKITANTYRKHLK